MRQAPRTPQGPSILALPRISIMPHASATFSMRPTRSRLPSPSRFGSFLETDVNKCDVSSLTRKYRSRNFAAAIYMERHETRENAPRGLRRQAFPLTFEGDLGLYSSLIRKWPKEREYPAQAHTASIFLSKLRSRSLGESTSCTGSSSQSRHLRTCPARRRIARGRRVCGVELR